MGTLSINTLGTSFTIQANEDSEHLQKLLDYYNRIAEELKSSGLLKNSTQIAIMAGILICDELYKEKARKISSGAINLYNSNQEEDDDEVEQRTLRMIEKISQVI